MADRRKAKDAGPPPPLLLLPASQSLTFTSEGASPMPGILMPVPLQQTNQDSNGFTACEFEEPSQDTSALPLKSNDNLAEFHPTGETPKSSKSWNSFRMTGKPQYAVPNLDSSGTSVPSQTELKHSNSTSFLTPSSSSGFMPGDPASSSDPSVPPPTSGFIPSGPSKSDALASSATLPSGGGQTKYIPVTYHWFFCKQRELRQLWEPFSFTDSVNLEDNFRSGNEANGMVSTDGGRYDVDIPSRMRKAVYWDEPDSKVRRCSWFYRHDGDSRLVPYEEEFAETLETMYKATLSAGDWHQKHELPNGDTIIFHSPAVIMQFCVQPGKAWNSVALNDTHPRVVKRGTEDLDNIYEGELTQVDHLVFIVHGIGPTCDLRFRNIIECVDDFRMVSHQMLASHFRQYLDEEMIGRVEFLPVRWHAALHGDATGIDRKLKAITLSSIGKLRQFTNDTLIDVLFYGSPAYAQKIADTVGNEINRLYQLFISRNPDFKGGISVAGHSLGSLILFDLLVHQRALTDLSKTQNEESCQGICSPEKDLTLNESFTSDSSQTDTEHNENPDDDKVQLTVNGILSQLNLADYIEVFHREQIDIDTLMMIEDKDLRELGLPLGPRKKLFCFINDQKSQKTNSKVDLATSSILEFQKASSVEVLAETSEPKDSDPVLRSASSTSVNYVVGDAGTGIPFIRYPQLDFSPDNFFALGSPIAMFLTVRGVTGLGEDFCLPTCSGFFNIFHPFDPVAYRIEPMVTTSFPVKPVLMPHHKGRKRLHLELKESLSRVGSDLKQKVIESVKSTWRTINDFALAHRSASRTQMPEEATEKDDENIVSDGTKDFDDTASVCSVVAEDDYPIGVLNQGRRVDYVLQEKPIESFNEYLFALGSHGCYWDSEDTVLLILKEIYATMGIAPQKPGPLPTQIQPPTVNFPRHPLAQTLHPTYSHPAQPVAPSLMSLVPMLPTDGEAVPPQSIGLPPMTGFVKK